MTDTASTKSPQLLDDAERQVHLAIALGRRLLANPHPSRPIYELQLHTMSNYRFGLRIWASREDASTLTPWSGILGAPVDCRPQANEPTTVHYTVDGVLDSVPLHVWTIATVPITRATIASNSRGVRIVYTQGGARRVLPQPSKSAARLWVAQHVRHEVMA